MGDEAYGYITLDIPLAACWMLLPYDNTDSITILAVGRPLVSAVRVIFPG